jgi:porin
MKIWKPMLRGPSPAEMRVCGALVAAGLVLLGTSFRSPARAADIGSAPSYSGDLFERSTLTGDWGGARNDLAKKGLTFDANLTQVEQGVVSGGKSGSWEYGGRGDLTTNLDTQKFGLWPGGFLTVELEGNWKDSVNGNTGALNPPNTNQLFPIPIDNNVALPNLSFAQFVSHELGFFAGKLQTVSTGDDNEFAHGKGDTQFMNLAFNINPVALVVPYSTLGAGGIVLPTADPNQAILNFSVLSANGKASTTGFGDLNGAIFAGSGRVRTDFFGLTGHQLVGALYSNKEYTSVDQRLGFVIENRALKKKDDTWSVFYNFDQFLYETDKRAGNGVGLFGRFGASEGDPVPEQYFYSIGVGGKGMIPSRDFDRFGIGYYYTSVNNPTLQVPFAVKSFLRDEWGFEAFYNVALTPWLLVTPDVQVIGPSQKREATTLFAREYIATATVLGVRVQLIL